MLLLFIYLFVALVFSFLCSIAEAVILSVTSAYIKLREQERHPAGALLKKLKADIDTPLAAILSLNTIAHTVGAAGVGAQAAVVFGSNSLGITSAVLTLLILVFSEIIPKTLGTYYWRQLAPGTAWVLKYLVIALFPLVWMSKRITGRLAGGHTLTGFSRQEFAAMAELGEQEGELAAQESKILKNLLLLRETRVNDVMTPGSVIFCLPEDLSVDEYFDKYRSQQRFSRIPVFTQERDHIEGFVLRSDLLLAKAHGDNQKQLKNFKRQLAALPHTLTLFKAFEQFLQDRHHIMLVVDEYGSIKGLVTLEDIVETLIGLEIVDESDRAEDMQKLARRLWQHRAQKAGLKIDEQPPE